jgi:hypothetical protein
MKMGDGTTAYSSLPYAMGDTSSDPITFTPNSATTAETALASATSGATLATIVAAMKRAISLNAESITQLNDDLTHFFENNMVNLTVQSVNPSLNEIAEHFAYSFGFFGAISLYCSVIGQVAAHSPLISIINPVTSMTNTNGFITAYINSFNKSMVFNINNDKIYTDSEPITLVGTTYCIYGVWYTR